MAEGFSTPESASQGLGFKSRFWQNSVYDCMVFYCIESYIIIAPDKQG